MRRRELRGNGLGASPPPFTFFRAESSRGRPPSAAEFRVGFGLSRDLSVELGVGYSTPGIRAELSQDAEAAAVTLDAEQLAAVCGRRRRDVAAAATGDRRPGEAVRDRRGRLSAAAVRRAHPGGDREASTMRAVASACGCAAATGSGDRWVSAATSGRRGARDGVEFEEKTRALAFGDGDRSSGNHDRIPRRLVPCAAPRPSCGSVSLTVGAGEVVALVGRSGSGKTTLLRLVNRMLTPSSGEVRVSGRAVGEWQAEDLRRQTGYVDAGRRLVSASARLPATSPPCRGCSAGRRNGSPPAWTNC